MTISVCPVQLTQFNSQEDKETALRFFDSLKEILERRMLRNHSNGAPFCSLVMIRAAQLLQDVRVYPPLTMQCQSCAGEMGEHFVGIHARRWLDYDCVALAVLITSISVLELIVFNL